MHSNFHIRCARANEIEALNHLIHTSADKLSQRFYSQQEIDGLNQYVFGVDKELIIDQTYYVIETKQGVLAACGGWSMRKTLFGGDQSASRIPGYLNPQKDPAKIRAFFIHPDFARQGLGTALLDHCEAQAREAGFTAVELMATLPGVPFYEKQGFNPKSDYTLTLPNGLAIKLLPMHKDLARQKLELRA